MIRLVSVDHECLDREVVPVGLEQHVEPLGLSVAHAPDEADRVPELARPLDSLAETMRDVPLTIAASKPRVDRARIERVEIAEQELLVRRAVDPPCRREALVEPPLLGRELPPLLELKPPLAPGSGSLDLFERKRAGSQLYEPALVRIGSSARHFHA